MKISACYIVKNEAKNLEKSLTSLGDNVDELIVVDTGSTDKTKEIAQAHGADIYNFSWQDDFALARNFALDRAKGDWVIFIDADESFVDSAGLRAYVEKADTFSGCEGLLLPRMEINVDTGTEQAEYTGWEYILRIWRNKPEFRFYGRVHEMLLVSEKNALRPPKMIEAHKKFTLHHIGYSTSIMPAKHRYYLALLQQEIKEKGEQPLSARYMADCYFGLGDYDKTAYYAKRAITRERQLGITTVAGVYRLYRYWLEAGKHLAWPLAQMREIAKQAIQDTAGEEHAREMQDFVNDLQLQWEMEGENVTI